MKKKNPSFVSRYANIVWMDGVQWRHWARSWSNNNILETNYVVARPNVRNDDVHFEEQNSIHVVAYVPLAHTHQRMPLGPVLRALSSTQHNNGDSVCELWVCVRRNTNSKISLWSFYPIEKQCFDCVFFPFILSTRASYSICTWKRGLRFLTVFTCICFFFHSRRFWILRC